MIDRALGGALHELRVKRPRPPGAALPVIVRPELGLPPEFPVTDLLSGERYRWRVGRNYVGLAPGQSHVLKLAS